MTKNRAVKGSSPFPHTFPCLMTHALVQSVYVYGFSLGLSGYGHGGSLLTSLPNLTWFLKLYEDSKLSWSTAILLEDQCSSELSSVPLKGAPFFKRFAKRFHVQPNNTHGRLSDAGASQRLRDTEADECSSHASNQHSRNALGSRNPLCGEK